MTQSSASLPVIAAAGTPPTAAVCPYLLAAHGRWRSASPAREHRCTAVAPATIIALEKQRRLCLAVEHGGCATYAAAEAHGIDSDAEGPVARVVRSSGRPLPRTAPLVLDHGRFPVPSGPVRERGFAQVALLALMAIAFVAIVIARTTGAPPEGEVLAGLGGPGASATRSAPVDPTDPPAPRSVAPGRSPEPDATGDPAPSASAAPTAAPTATPRPTTYKVRGGDTLSGIATEFGTTVRALAELNDIDDPSRLRIGQELELPPAE